jgi:hypothetical protein
MKKLVLTVFGALIGLSGYAQSDEQLIQQTVEKFFEGMYKRDTLLIKSVMHPDCALNSVIIRPDKPISQKKDAMAGFYKSISSIPANVKLEERLLEHKIQVDVALATDWTPYELYVNDKLSHKGTNVFTLTKIDNVWKIFAIIDTRKI